MYYLLRVISLWTGRLSPARTEFLAGVLTFLWFGLLRVRRRLILRNLNIAFGNELSQPELKRIASASVYNFILNILEFLRSSTVDISEHIIIEGKEHIDAALKQGKGVYCLCFHLGNWEAMGSGVTRYVCPSHVLVKKVGSASLDRFVRELRAKIGFGTIVRQKKGDGYEGIKQVLSKGEIVGFVMDQARPGNPKIDFFAQPAKTNTSFAAIWQRVKAPIIPAYIIRTSLGKHTIHFLPEVILTETGNPAVDITNHSLQFNKIIERCIRKNPDQYFWMHNRWKE